MLEHGRFVRPARWAIGGGPEHLESVSQAESAVAAWLARMPDRLEHHEERERIRRRFGVLYQGGALWSSMTVLENVELPLGQYTDLSSTEIHEVANLKLALVGLPGAGDLYPDQLSGGMQKRAVANLNFDMEGLKLSASNCHLRVCESGLRRALP